MDSAWSRPLGIVVGVLLAVGGVARSHGDLMSVNFSAYSGYQTVTLKAGTKAPVTDAIALLHISTPLGGQFASFCIEVQESIGVGTYTFDVQSLSMVSRGAAPGGPAYTNANNASSNIPAGGIGAERAALIGLLYDGYYGASSPTNAYWTADNIGAFQLAVWELSHDSDGSLTNAAGSFYVTAGQTATRVTRAQLWVDAVRSLRGGGAVPQTQLMGLLNDGLVPLPARSDGTWVQDLLMPVGQAPEPGTAACLSLSALALWAAGRLRRKDRYLVSRVAR